MLKKTGTCRHILVIPPNAKLNEYAFRSCQVVTCEESDGQADRETDRHGELIGAYLKLFVANHQRNRTNIFVSAL